MKLQEIFDQLKYGELAQLSVGGAGAGEVTAGNFQILLSTINLGLSNLHHRFNLKKGKLKLAIQPGKTLYELNEKFAESNRWSREPVKYLLDAGNPYLGDLAKIQEIKAESGVAFPLNDGSEYSMSTPRTFTLVIPEGVASPTDATPKEYRGDTLEIEYRATHPKLVVSADDFDLEESMALEVDLPYPYLEPLLYFIASRHYHPLGASEGIHMGSTYAVKYDAACKQLEMANLGIDQAQANDRLTRNGWV